MEKEKCGEKKMNKPSFTKRPERPVTPKSIPKVCNHSYRLLDDETRYMYADGEPAFISVSAVFFCEKCLNLKHKHETLKGESDD